MLPLHYLGRTTHVFTKLIDIIYHILYLKNLLLKQSQPKTPRKTSEFREQIKILTPILLSVIVNSYLTLFSSHLKFHSFFLKIKKK